MRVANILNGKETVPWYLQNLSQSIIELMVGIRVRIIHVFQGSKCSGILVSKAK